MNQKSTLTADTEESLYARVRDLVVSARQTVARGVDLVQVRTNFEIGRHIIEFEQQGADRADYGAELLTLLAQRLSDEFGKGFARSNIAYRQRSAIVQTLSGQSETPQSNPRTFPARKSCSKSCRNGPGTWLTLMMWTRQTMTGRRNDS